MLHPPYIMEICQKRAAYGSLVLGGVLTLAFAFPTWAATVIGTSTTNRAFHSSSRFHTHYAAGQWWVAYHDGTRPLIASSPDGTTWTPQGAIFASFDPTADGRWAVRYSGNRIAALGYNDLDTDRYYRSGTMNGDGTITWNPAASDWPHGPVDSGWPQINTGVVNGKPIRWRAGSGNAAEGGLKWGDQLDTPAWGTPALFPPELAPTTLGGFSAGAILPTGGADPDDLIILRATTVSPAAASSHRLVTLKYDAGADAYDAAWYNVSTLGGSLTEDLATEVKDVADNGIHWRFAAVSDTSGNIHAVYVNRNDQVAHYKKAVGFNDSWDRVSANATQSPAGDSVQLVGLTAGRDNKLYLFYQRNNSAPKNIYYRRWDGFAWEGEYRVDNDSAETLQGLGLMESADGSPLGLAWARGSGPYEIVFKVLDECPSLQTSDTASTITVKEPATFEMTFSTATGGSFGSYYDLQEDPTKLNDLAGGDDMHTSLLSDGVTVSGINYSTDEALSASASVKMDLLEATPTRVRVRREAPYVDDGRTAAVPGLKNRMSFTVYPSGKMAVRTELEVTLDVTYTSLDLGFAVYQNGSPPFTDWSAYSESGNSFPYTGSERFHLFRSGTGGLRQDFLHIIHKDWTSLEGYQAEADNLFFENGGGLNFDGMYWEENTGDTLSPGYDDAWSFLTCFHPTIFEDNLDAKVTERRDDYRNPDDLANPLPLAAGSGWFDASENTLPPSDFFNESEGVYCLELDQVTGLEFDLDGGTTRRYRPVFKIRNWRSLQDPSVTVENIALTNDLDYRADVKPISDADFADRILFHTTLQSFSAVTTPDIGDGTGAAENTMFYDLARYGSGAQFDSTTDYIDVPLIGGDDGLQNLELDRGRIEFWYLPNYNHDDNTGHYLLDLNNNGNCRIRITKEDNVLSNRLTVDVVDSTPISHTVLIPSANYQWTNGEWLHVAMDWDSTDATDNIHVYLNGIQLTPSAPSNGAFTMEAESLTGYLRIGNQATAASTNADGFIDELTIYDAVAPTQLARGGLTSDPSEYLARGDGPSNFQLAFNAADAHRRGEYLYLGSDSEYRGLNIGLATPGDDTLAPDLKWQFWNGTGWADLDTGFGFDDTQLGALTEKDGTLFWTSDPTNWAPHSVNGGPDLYYVRAYLASGSYNGTPPTEGIIKTDVLLFQYSGDVSADGHTFAFDVPMPTAVDLVFLEAAGLDGAVEIQWQTAAELNNLGFRLYRALSEDGPYELVTPSPIPGLGSSPLGARYSYRDEGLVNGVTYYYKLEDIETTGKTKLHGPVSATPQEGLSGPPPSETTPNRERGTPTLITFGDPSSNELRVAKDGARVLELELLTRGFFAEPLEDGTVRIFISDFESASGDVAHSLPVKRSWIEALTGWKAKVASVQAKDVEVFEGLIPSSAEVGEVVGTRQGTVRVSQRRTSRRPVLSPPSTSWPRARVLLEGFQGDLKKALVELAPFTWDPSTGGLSLTRRLRVKLTFTEREPSETTRDGARGRRYRKRMSHEERGVVARLVAVEKGLYGARFEDIFGRGGSLPVTELRLSRQGEAVAYHVEPDTGSFGPGSTLHFLSGGAAINPYGNEAVYELELGSPGETMVVSSASPEGEKIGYYWQTIQKEENRFYQAGLVDAPDLWLWDLLFAPTVKSYPFDLSRIALTSQNSRVSLWLQGASDLPPSPDHHVKVYVNTSLVDEGSWDGKRPQRIDIELPAVLIREGENTIEIENVGDTGSPYSMVMLNRFTVEYPRLLAATAGRWEGSFPESGTAEITGLAPGAFVVEIREGRPGWLTGTEFTTEGLLRFRAEAERSYQVESPDRVLRPEIRKVKKTRLKSTGNRAEYVVIAPQSFLAVTEPLLSLRRDQGLLVTAVAMEDVYSEFGFGETTPNALKDFLIYAYHHWRPPSLRYVLLLGDATFDFKDYLKAGAGNLVPALIVKTSFLWTASDPSYACVNGDDILPDLAVGRLPAASLEEARLMVDKIVAYETSHGDPSAPVVLVADNPDDAGDFVGDAEELALDLLANRPVRRIYLSRLGRGGTHTGVIEAFEQGSSLISYIGHGGIHIWADENIFNTDDVGSLAVQSQQPLVLTMNCLNGYFHFPYFDALSEELLKAEGKGAIAAFSPSGLSLNGPAHLYHRALLAEIFNGSHDRLGDAVLAAQAVYATLGVFPELLSIYHIMGDPALRLW